MRVTTDDGVGLEVEVTGTGPALVLAHGFTGAKEDFADHVAELARHSTVVIFDHRGHGGSDKPEREDAYSLDRLAADTLAIADALDVDRFRLLGHSMGGMVARRVALAAPDRVMGLILMSTSPAKPSGVDPDLATMGAAVARTEGMVVLRQLLDEMDPLGTEADRRVRRERPGYEDFGRKKFFAVPPVTYAALLLDIVHQPDQLAELASVTCPALVIVGEQDAAFLPDAHAMAGVLSDVELVVIPDAGHSPQFENPAAYLAALEGFLARVDAGTRS
jgi:pimeloyl-ACP methyl ester carboxylesterase